MIYPYHSLLRLSSISVFRQNSTDIWLWQELAAVCLFTTMAWLWRVLFCAWTWNMLASCSDGGDANWASRTHRIPSTEEGPFVPVTVPDLCRISGSDDLPHSDPRLVRRVPVNFPDQIAIALSDTPLSLWVSWITGDAQIGPHVVPLDPSSVSSEVYYGTQSGNYTNVAMGSAQVYNQIYPYEGLLNYTSGIIHRVRLEGLAPNTTYYYVCGDSSLPAMSEEKQFTTLPWPSADDYPPRIAIVGDLGLTYNSTTTIDHLQRNMPSLLLMLGDLSYANNYITTGESAACYSCAFPDTPIRESYQPHWDAWGRFMEPLTSQIPMMVIEGNHEIEPQAENVTFASYTARFAVPGKESGSGTSLYYSFDAGGIHFIMLGGYVDYNRTGHQYAWLMEDLQRVDRQRTPWLIAAMHPPWYNSYRSHYREVECMRMEMEDLLYRSGVDIVFSGHVHAYERCNRVYNYELDPCASVYITVGDGGNIERVDVAHADDPGQCPEPDESFPEYGGICPFNFTSGPARGKYCWDTQPEWSALRDSSFGHGILEVLNATHALWTWHRNQDAYGKGSVGDQIYVVRRSRYCGQADLHRVNGKRGLGNI